MPVLQLNAEDATELQGILENYFSELRMEIERTENANFRHRLQAREQLVKRIIGELKS
jgi:hypothetical protein